VVLDLGVGGGIVTTCWRVLVLIWSCILRFESSDVEISACEEGRSLTIGHVVCLLSVAAVGYEYWLDLVEFSLFLFSMSASWSVVADWKNIIDSKRDQLLSGDYC
jgi:hypothetical protein